MSCGTTHSLLQRALAYGGQDHGDEVNGLIRPLCVDAKEGADGRRHQLRDQLLDHVQGQLRQRTAQDQNKTI